MHLALPGARTGERACYRSRMSEEIESKSALKREDRRLRELGVRVAELSEEQIAALPLDEALRTAVTDYRRIQSHEARRRHTHFIGKLMRRADVEAIEAALEGLTRKHAEARFAHHTLERWRERLLADDEALTEFMAENPLTDVQQLRQLIRRVRARPDDSARARALFRFLREATESQT